MYVQNELDVRPDGITHRSKLLDCRSYRAARFEHVALGRQSPPDVSPAGFDRRQCRVDNRADLSGATDDVGIARDVLADSATKKIVYGDAECLALEIPQGHVDAGNDRREHPFRREEQRTGEYLPQVFAAKRVGAENARLDVCEGAHHRTVFAGEPALADAVRAVVDVHDHEQTARNRERLDSADLHRRSLDAAIRPASLYPCPDRHLTRVDSRPAQHAGRRPPRDAIGRGAMCHTLQPLCALRRLHDVPANEP